MSTWPTHKRKSAEETHVPTPYYQDDLTTLYHADCLQHLDILDQADVMVTDPPYGVDHRPGRMSNFDSDRSTIAGDLTTDARDTVLNRWGGGACHCVRIVASTTPGGDPAPPHLAQDESRPRLPHPALVSR